MVDHNPSFNAVLLDLVMPGMDGRELLQRIRQDPRLAGLRVVMTTGHTGPRARSGVPAEAFLTKPFGEEALLSAIRQALERSRRALEHVEKTKALRQSYASLTPREREVMALVVSGLLNKQVGGELGISEITVKAHRGQVMRKMRADSLPALVNMVARLDVATAAAS